jgi:hypothetical protein
VQGTDCIGGKQEIMLLPNPMWKEGEVINVGTTSPRGSDDSD